MASTRSKVRGIILAASAATIVATGAFYGAGLKTQTERKHEQRIQMEATPAERIAHLEQRKGILVAKRNGLQKKIDEIRERMARKEAAKT
ncbi:MAG: hypothetical protein M1816_006516 [Peltula sp. TS41687]|nr:MAG: hypothetical protein M1816_006516 [Peltula sp. TS41687]